MSACMGGAHDSGVLSSTCDVPQMSVVRGVGGVCDMCKCLARVGGEWNRGSVGRVSVFWLRWCSWTRVGRVQWCYVCVSLDSLCRWQVHVNVYCA